MDGNNTYYANGYLVHNKWSSWWWGGSKTPSCEKASYVDGDKIRCESNIAQAYFRLICDGKEVGTSDKKDWYHDFDATKCQNAETIECSVSSSSSGPYKTSAECSINSEEDLQWCFNVNEWNFSIEEWEIMPFYRNMANLDSRYYGNEDSYTEMNGRYEDAEDNLVKKK